MSDTEYTGRGKVCMNPNGPHFYVHVEEGEKPPGMVDIVTDRMNTLLREVDADHGWNVSHGYIKGHEPITEAVWEHDEDKPYNIDLHIECPAVSETWYSRRQLREYNYDDYTKPDIVVL